MGFEIFNENTPRIRGVLFDMDGLVLDSEKLYCRFWMEAAQALGFPMTMEQALGMRSLSNTAGQAQLESGKTYTYELSAVPGTGERYVLKTFTFVQ